jgi:hypothetical protein
MMRRKTLKWIAGSLIMLLLQIPFLCRDVPLLVFRLMSESPLACGTVTSGYGLRIAPIRGGIEFHDGVDLSAPECTPDRRHRGRNGRGDRLRLQIRQLYRAPA